ncbi:MAG: F0F1 ATP synthase subunit gamma [Proteobacteria bacterium]|nr:F0F1 ATP synthase subunit gamma [Pseudomonadota bacterium]
MPNLKATKKRIVSVKNTQKITKAMKLVSASKFARTLDRRNDAKHYESCLHHMMSGLIAQARVKELLPYLLPRYVSSENYVAPKNLPSLLIVIAADRGLCGSLNAGVVKLAKDIIDGKQTLPLPSHNNAIWQQSTPLSLLKDELLDHGFFADQKTEKWDVLLWGKKSWSLAKMFLSMENAPRVLKKENAADLSGQDVIKDHCAELLAGFARGSWQKVMVVSSCFESALVQRAYSSLLFPVDLWTILGGSQTEETGDTNTTLTAHKDSLRLWEPDPNELVHLLAQKIIEHKLFSMLLEGSVCEHAARMTAMDNATQNAGEVIKDLTLQYNRARQAAITTELVEITSGAEAL